MQVLKPIRDLFFLFPCILILCFVANAQALNYRTCDLSITAHNEKLVKHVKEISDKACPRLNRLTGATPQNIKIIVAKDDDEFQSMARKIHGARWAAGLAVPSKNLIIVRSPRQLTSVDSFRTVLIHELTHIYLGQILHHNKIPLWLEEGLAMHASGESGLGRSFDMAKGVLTEKLITFSKLEKTFPTELTEVSIAYAQSYYFVGFILSKYGNQGIAKLLLGIKNSKDLSGALHKTFGHGLVSLENEFKAEMESRFSWIAVITTAGTIWVIIAIIAAIGLVIRRKSQLKKVEQMEDEEEIVALNETDLKEKQQKPTQSPSPKKAPARADLKSQRNSDK